MSRLKSIDLNNVRYLLEAVDAGSFSAAARIFGVPPSLVSRMIARLEQDLGARLLQRTTRSLSLTNAGQAFLNHARTGMQSLLLAQESASDSQGALSGRIRLSVPVGAAHAAWATISRFLLQHPAVRVEMEVGDRYVDLVKERFDMAVRAGAEKRGERLIGRWLLDAPRWLFASPRYLSARGTPRTVDDLTHHDCVILGARAERVAWKIYVGKRIQTVMVRGRVAVNEATLATECVVDGFGIGFLPRALCVKQMTAGTLKRVIPNASAGDSGLWLVYPDRHLPAASRALVDFLLRELPTSVTVDRGL